MTTPDLLTAAQRILASLEWEEQRSGTTYDGYETLRAAVDQATADEAETAEGLQ